MTANQRKNFLINKPLQIRFMLYITLPVMVITTVIMLGLYIGIWGNMLEAFSNERVRNDLLTASRLTEYENARLPQGTQDSSTLRFFKQAEKLSARQREVFKDILDDTNKKIIPKFFLLLVFMAWGTVFISHKIAGPFFRFNATLDEVARGNLRVRIHLRKKDEGRSLASRFNKTLGSLDETFSRIKNIIRENDSQPERMAEKLKEELSKIKTSGDV
jgi:methyl-accepting chemotaxis protein